MTRTLSAAPLAGLLLLAGCGGGVARPELHAPAPQFDPLAFFAGDSRGEGRLKKLFSPAERVQVTSHGALKAGTLVLDQRVVEGEKPPRDRQWRIRPLSPGRYTGTLTDAAGPIAADVDGNRLHIRYRMKDGGLGVDQWIYLRPDGRSAQNEMSVTKLGVEVAHLSETITRGS